MIEHIRAGKVALDELPFIKRYGFRDEREFRMLHETKHKIHSKDIPFPLECIDRVTINPWLNVRLADAVFDTVHALDGCANLSIGQSSLVNNGEWRKLAARGESHSSSAVVGELVFHDRDSFSR